MVSSCSKETTSAATSSSTTTISAGAAAWVRRHPHNSSASLWWPCLVYPSWKYASMYSGWMTEDIKVRIEGCKKPVAVSHLAKNIVPQKAALRPLPQQTTASPQSPHPKQYHKDSKQPRPPHRLVAYYLGLEEDDGRVAHWAAVKVETLQPYRANALEMVRSHHPKLARLDRLQWTRAMDEMATALDDPSLSFHNLSEELRADDIHNNNATLGMGQTPEFFDDWQPSGTYGASQSQSQRFTQFSQGGLGASLVQQRSPTIPTIEENNAPTTTSTNEIEPQNVMTKTPTQAKPGEEPTTNSDNQKAGEDDSIMGGTTHHNGEQSPPPTSRETDPLEGGGGGSPTPRPVHVMIPPQSAAKEEVVRLASVTPSPHPLSNHTAPASHWNSHIHGTPSTKCDDTRTNMELDDDAAGVKRLFFADHASQQQDAPNDDLDVKQKNCDEEGGQAAAVSFQRLNDAQAPIGVEANHKTMESTHAPNNGTEPQDSCKENATKRQMTTTTTTIDNTMLSNEDMEEVPSSQDECGAFYTQQL